MHCPGLQTRAVSNKPSKVVEFLQALGFVAAISVLFFLLWLALLALLSFLLFIALSLLTQWTLLGRLGVSLLGAFLFLKLAWLILQGVNLLPASWLEKPEPAVMCPYCGKPLRTPRARQCQHCLRHWHEVPEEEIEQLRATRKAAQDWSIRSE